MAVTAAFVVAATVTAERAGPLVGGLVATLPIGAGPVYVFLALDHDAHFIAQSALGSLATNALNVVFALVYTLLAQKRSLASACRRAPASGWSSCRLRSRSLALVARRRAGAQRARPDRRLHLAVATAAPRARCRRVEARWYDYAAARRHGRAARRRCGDVELPHRPDAERLLAVFPIVLTSIMLILHTARRRPGRPRRSWPMRCSDSAASASPVSRYISPPSRSAVGRALLSRSPSSIGCSLTVWQARRLGMRGLTPSRCCSCGRPAVQDRA